MRGAPQRGFALAIFLISLRVSESIEGRPGPFFRYSTQNSNGPGTEGVEMKKAPTTEVMRALVLELLKKRAFNNSYSDPNLSEFGMVSVCRNNCSSNRLKS